MKRFAPLVLVLLAGCQSGPRETLYKAGSLAPERQAAYDACKIASFRKIPQALVTEYTPGYHDPGVLQCQTDRSGTTCMTMGAIDLPAHAETRDVNAALRKREVERCLIAGGYRLLLLPLCPNAADRQRLRAMPQPENPDEMVCRPDDGPAD